MQAATRVVGLSIVRRLAAFLSAWPIWWLAFLVCPSLWARADEEDPGRRLRPDRPAEVCAVAESNLARALSAVAKLSIPTSAKPSAVRWDARQPLVYAESVQSRFALRPSERERLAKQGFFVSGRLPFANHTTAYHELHQSQMPLFVTIDSILHALSVSQEHLQTQLERTRLFPALLSLLEKAAAAYPARRSLYPPQTAQDLAVYLSVAAQLAGQPQHLSSLASGDPSVASQTASLLAHIDAASALRPVELFGRTRLIDFTVYTPRGHYVLDESLTRYFRAALWLSRLELNLVSRSSRSSAPGMTPDPRSTPREILLALALADLIEHSHATEPLALIDRAWTFFHGPREDVSVADLHTLRDHANLHDLRDPTVPSRLQTAIGNRFQRTARLHPMPEGSRDLPAIATLIGPRVPPDLSALRLLTHSELPDRHTLPALDLAFLFGQDAALALQPHQLAQYPTLSAQLHKARAQLPPLSTVPQTLYHSWLNILRILGQRATESAGVPSFVGTEAYAALGVNSVLAGYAALRHGSVLGVGNSYEEGGCEIPDGYVEGSPALYDEILGHVRRARQLFSGLDPGDQAGGTRYFLQVEKTLAALGQVVRWQRTGVPLPLPARQFLAMVVEILPGHTGRAPTYTGWYFDLFADRVAGGIADVRFVADYHTSAHLQQVSYLGVDQVDLGFFVVDVGGPPRLMVGPTARVFSHVGPLATRLTDDSVASLPSAQKDAPWSTGYRLASPPVPFSLDLDLPLQAPLVLTVTTSQPLPDVELSLLDHHRRVLVTLRRSLPTGTTTLTYPLRGPAGRAILLRKIEGLRVQVGAHSFWATARLQIEPGIGLHVAPSL